MLKLIILTNAKLLMQKFDSKPFFSCGEGGRAEKVLALIFRSNFLVREGKSKQSKSEKSYYYAGWFDFDGVILLVMKNVKEKRKSLVVCRISTGF
jgi:hypothetical protein